MSGDHVAPTVTASELGLPEWAQRDRYDASATSPLSRPATPEERAAMMRAMLVERRGGQVRRDPAPRVLDVREARDLRQRRAHTRPSLAG